MAREPIRRNPTGAYVYEIVVNGTTRYFGKGRRGRHSHHVKIATNILKGTHRGRGRKRQVYVNLARAIAEGEEIAVFLVMDGLSDDAAFALETECIANAPLGQLWNEAPGGEGASSEYLKAYWAAHPEVLTLISELAKSSWAANPSRKFARFREPGSRQIQSEMMRRKWEDPAYRQMQRDARRRGKKRAKTHPSEKRRRLAVERWQDPEFRRKTSEAIRRAKRLSKPVRGQGSLDL